MAAANQSASPIALLAGGGHALVVAEAAIAAGLTLAGFMDDDPAASLAPLPPHDLPHHGPLERAHQPGHELRLHLAIGDVRSRRRVLDALDVDPDLWTTIIHPSAHVSPSARIEPGSFISAGAIINGRTEIGAHAIINTGAIVEHDCEIAHNVHLAPRAVLGGNVTVGCDTLIGIGATIRPGISIGKNCTIGAGAVVVSNVEINQTALGVPARAIGAPVA